MPSEAQLPPLYAVSRSTRQLPQIPDRVRAVLEVVADNHRIKLATILGHSRRHRITRARQAAWARIRDLPTPFGRPFSYPQIAAWFGMDHSTVIYGVRKHREREAMKVAAE